MVGTVLPAVNASPLSRGERPTTPSSRASISPSASWISSSCFIQQGSSYAELYNGEAKAGSPGQDLRRLEDGPSLYINGPPNQGSKMSFERSVLGSHRGRFAPGSRTSWPNSGPGQLTQLVMDRKPACSRSMIGPDPYGVTNTNLWLRRNKALHFAPDDGSVRLSRPIQPFCLRSGAFDPYHLTSKNSWLHESQSHKSMEHAKLLHGVRASPQQAMSPFPARVSMRKLASPSSASSFRSTLSR